MYNYKTVPSFLVVKLHSQIAKLGEVNTKSTATIINVLPIQCLQVNTHTHTHYKLHDVQG